jgi:uncharacterized protein (DUF1778 family)
VTISSSRAAVSILRSGCGARKPKDAVDGRVRVDLPKHGELPYKPVRSEFMPSAHEKPASSKREYKTQRLELRSRSAKKVIQQAMSVTGLAAGDLAYEGARRLLDEYQRIILSAADRGAFLAAVDRNPDPSPRLIEALKRHRHLLG